MQIDSKRMRGGVEIPVIGLGTWQLRGDECTEAVHQAIELGYRHFDTAVLYENQRDIGRAISEYPREELFLTSKVPHTDLLKKDFLAAAERILKELRTDYLDLLLIHWPNKSIPMEEPLLALAELLHQEKITAAGVSNFTVAHLEQALALDIVPIVNNQVECHPFLPQTELLHFCDMQEIVVTAYSPLARGGVEEESVLTELAQRYDTSPEVVSLSWLIGRGCVVVPKATSRRHLRENLEAALLELTQDEMRRIEAIERTDRLIEPEWAEFDQAAADG